MNPIRILPTSALAAALAFTNPASAGVVFSESFEAPVVAGFDDNTVPSGGKWIGSNQGFNASNRGLYNETVAWPATPPYTTPYGAQAYFFNYTNTGLTTSEGATGQTLTANVPYKVSFNTAVTAGAATAAYRVELVAFNGEARNDARGTFGAVLATATGNVNTNDMSAAASFTFTPAADNAHLGKDVAIRLKFSNASVLYDNIRLITGHDMNPSPASGVILPAGNTVLNWTNVPPNTPGGNVPVDVFFGTNPAALTQIVDGALTSSTTAIAPSAATYYWRVDSYPDGNANGTPVTGDIFSFIVIDTDSDGLPDSYELANTNPSSPTALDPSTDLDTDGLTALQEYTYGTSPTNPDTDGDTLLDGPELTGVGLRPPTSPVDFDSDNDGLSDGAESNTGTWVSASNTGTNPRDTDKDKDGLMDGAETNTGTLVDKNNTGTDPFAPDTDNDGAGDYYEVYACFTSPFNPNEKPRVPYPLPDPDVSAGVTNKPVKVYIMSGQSNMVGLGKVYGTEDRSLETMTLRQNKFPNLVNDAGGWTQRQDVLYRGVISAIHNKGLIPGCGADSNSMGPELGFGHIMGWYHDEPVLLLKSSIGNRSLAWDILPPGSPGYGSPIPTTPGAWYGGKQYDMYFKDELQWAHPDTAVTNVVDVLDNFAAQYPNWASQGFEIAGFVWWQGERDLGNATHANQYEANLVRLIESLRTYYTDRYNNDLNGQGESNELTKVATNAPFVLGTLGETSLAMTSPANAVAIRDAHLAVDSTTGSNPQTNVKTVYTHPLSEGGEGNNHYLNRAGTYVLVGDAMGRAMIDLLEVAAGPDVTPPAATSFIPANGASDVSTGTNLVATFNESIAIGTGNITIHPIDNSGDIVIAITDASQATVSGTTLTINPAANLSPSKQYAVQIDATAIDDLAGNSYAGITGDTTWSFTTATPDTTDPSLSTTDPANAASDVLVTASLVATFSEPVAIGTGNITLKNLSDGTQATIAVTDTTQVSISGSVLTVNPAANLLSGKTYAVQIETTAIDDLVGNSYAGITDDSSWSFTTAPPDLTPPSPDPMSFDVLPNALGETTVTMTATTATDPGGVEYLFECSVGGGPDSEWQIANVFTATGLNHSTTYTYTVKARDASLNETAPSAPASATTATPDTTAPTFSTSNPANGASGVLHNANLVATFSEPIAIGTGNITIKNLSDSTQTTITLPNSQVTIAGSVLTINPTSDLAGGKNYAIQIAATAVKDLANNNFPGIANDTTWNFTTAPLEGTWNVDSDGLWSVSGNWFSGIIPSGSGYTANLTHDITADRTVNLDGDRTLTGVVFGDSDVATPGSWILNNNSVSGNNLVLAGTTPTITVNALGTDKTATISAIIQGTVGLSKSGNGTLILSGDNTYSGGTTINAGTLQLGNGGSTGSIANTAITNNGSLVINRTGAAQGLGVISGTGSVTLTNGTGLSLNGGNSFSGGFNLNGGSLANFATGTYNGFGSGTLTIGSGASGTWTMPTSSATTIPNAIQWNRASTNFNRSGSSGIGLVTFDGNVTLGQSITLNQSSSTVQVNFVFNGNIGDGGSGYGLSVTGTQSGSLTLNGTNTFTGPMSVKGLAIGGSGSLGSGSFAGNITASSGLTYSSSVHQKLSGTNSITGLTTVSAGTLQFAKTASLTSSAANRLNVKSGATLALSVGGTGEFSTSNVATVLTNQAASTGATNGMNAGSNFGFDTTNASGASFTIGNVIADSTGAGGGVRGLTKLGTGTLVLSVSNTYTGPTQINGGTLLITGAAQSTSAITFGGGKLGLDIATPVTAASATVNFTGQTVLVTGTPTLPSYTLLTANSMTGTPTLAAPISGYTLQVVGSELRLVTGAANPYDTWAGPGVAFDADANNDGVDNGMAWVLGAANPSTNVLPLLPTMDNTTDPNFFIFTYRRDDDATADPKTTIKVEYGSNLATWTTAVAGPDIIITPTNEGAGAGIDLVQVKIRRTLAVGATLFARLSTVNTP